MDWHKDISFVKASVGEIKSYLLSEQLFWPLETGERLTLGMLNFSLKRLEAVELSLTEQAIINDLRDSIAKLRQEWRSNWSKKAEIEFSARLRQWEKFLDEFITKNQKNELFYRHEVTLRVLLQLLKDEILELSVSGLSHLDMLDRRLRAKSQLDDFIWDSELKDIFPRDLYWFLYIKL